VKHPNYNLKDWINGSGQLPVVFLSYHGWFLIQILIQ